MRRFCGKLFSATIITTLLFISPLRGALAEHPLFNLEEKKAQLQLPENKAWRDLCEAATVSLTEPIEPISKITSTDDYGTHNQTAPFAWQVMILGSRALAGNKNAADTLSNLLLKWEKADALLATETAPDSYYELKRTLLPTIVNFAIIAPDLAEEHRQKIETWLEKLVKKSGHVFDGNTDHNNHRQLTDSVRMAWAIYAQDDAVYIQSQRGFQKLIDSLSPQAFPPLEITRGARASWYIRQVLSSMTLMAHMATLRGDELFSYEHQNTGINALLNGFLNSYYTPLSLFPSGANNETPGPSKNYLNIDTGYTNKRGHGRHYLAFTEILHANEEYLQDFTHQRLLTFDTHIGLTEQHPLIDEFSGGNASCFFGGRD